MDIKELISASQDGSSTKYELGSYVWYKHIEQDSPDKRCGTCINFCDGCRLGWIYTNPNKSYVPKKAVTKNDGVNCADWQVKPKEKVRVLGIIVVILKNCN